MCKKAYAAHISITQSKEIDGGYDQYLQSPVAPPDSHTILNIDFLLICENTIIEGLDWV